MTKADRQRELYWRLSLWLPKEWRERVHTAVDTEGTTINAVVKDLIAERFALRETDRG